MKIISLSSKPNRRSGRVPSKDESFWIEKDKVDCSILKIPENDACSTENTDNPCKASKYVKCLKKLHKKVDYKTLYCKSCNGGRKLKDIDRKKILHQTKVPRFQTKRLCIRNSDNACPRVSQVRDWLIYCKFKRYFMSKCKEHSSLYKKIKEDVEIRYSVMTEIFRN